jgi:hypothetical protein
MAAFVPLLARLRRACLCLFCVFVAGHERRQLGMALYMEALPSIFAKIIARLLQVIAMRKNLQQNLLSVTKPAEHATSFNVPHFQAKLGKWVEATNNFEQYHCREIKGSRSESSV